MWQQPTDLPTENILFQEALQGTDKGRCHPDTLWTLGLPGERKTQYPGVGRFQKGLASLRAG